MTPDNKQTRLDELTQARLTKLASRPVDTSAVADRLRAEMDRQRDDHEAKPLVFPAWSRWVSRGVAAAVLLIVAALFVTSQSGSPVYAAPAEMAQLHRDLVNGRAPVIPVSDIAEAQRAIESKWAAAPALPDRWDDNVHACCLRDLQSRQVACILVKQDDAAVTVVVARTKDFQSPEGPTVQYNGRSYVAHSRDGVNMVMTQEKDRWMCLMSELPVEDLLAMAGKITGPVNPK
jgi:hypothetical protein